MCLFSSPGRMREFLHLSNSPLPCCLPVLDLIREPKGPSPELSTWRESNVARPSTYALRAAQDEIESDARGLILSLSRDRFLPVYVSLSRTASEAPPLLFREVQGLGEDVENLVLLHDPADEL